MNIQALLRTAWTIATTFIVLVIFMKFGIAFVAYPLRIYSRDQIKLIQDVFSPKFWLH